MPACTAFRAAGFIQIGAYYAAGARYVDVIWGDEEMLRLRAKQAPRNSFEEYPSWHINGLMNMVKRGNALLSLNSNNPDLLAGLDPDFLGGMQKTHLKNYSPVSAAVARNAVKWISGQSLAENGVVFTANIPTEEIFTLPDSRRAEGEVAATATRSISGEENQLREKEKLEYSQSIVFSRQIEKPPVE